MVRQSVRQEREAHVRERQMAMVETMADSSNASRMERQTRLRAIRKEARSRPVERGTPSQLQEGAEVNTETQINALKAEIKKLRKLGRTKREPVKGFGGVIQQLREQGGIGLRQLATYSGVSAGMISRIEQDAKANPCLQTIVLLARGLKVTPANLMALTYERKK